MAKKNPFDNKHPYGNYSKGLVNMNAVEVVEKRKNFDSLPSFVQAGLFLYEKYVNTRRQEFLPRVLSFDIIKAEGNHLFSRANYDEAARKYEEVTYEKRNRH